MRAPSVPATAHLVEMLDVEAVYEVLVLLVVLHHCADGGGVEQQHGSAADEQHGAPRAFRRQVPGRGDDKSERQPQSDDESSGDEHVSSVHGLDSVFEFGHQGFLPRRANDPEAGLPPHESFAAGQFCFLAGNALVA